MSVARKPVLLLILDGWGLASPESGGDANSAIALAATPNWDRIWNEFPQTRLVPHGEAVGLTEGQMGNSEVGHLNLGAGRVVYQDLVAITKLIGGGGLEEHDQLNVFLDGVGTGVLHFIGLFSDGGVHSHIDHLIGVANHAVRHMYGADLIPSHDGSRNQIYIHALLDGRDTPPAMAEQFFEYAEIRLPERCRFATLGGRYFGMDRDKRWERTRLHWDAIVRGRGEQAVDWQLGMTAARKRNQTDEFVTPTVLGDYRGVAAGDSVIFFNFRADRVRQLTEALGMPDFDGFDRGDYPHVRIFTFTQYRDDFPFPTLLDDEPLPETLAEVCSHHGLTIYKSAETEKYAHVTYFFNGGREEPWPGEDRVLIPSSKVATYDLQPEMSVHGVTAELVNHLVARDHDLYVVNLANPDMVGHTGVAAASIRACEAVDECLGQVLEAVGWGRDATVIVTADHGNCDQLYWPDGTPHTQHSMNEVPLILVDEPRRELRQPEEWPTESGSRTGGHPPCWSLCDVAPTILDLLGLEMPSTWNGISLLKK